MPLMYEVRSADGELRMIAPSETLETLLSLDAKLDENASPVPLKLVWPRVPWPPGWFPLSIKRLPLELSSPPPAGLRPGIAGTSEPTLFTPRGKAL